MHTLLIKGNLWQHSMQKPQAISHHAPDNCISRHALDNHNFTQHAFRNISSCYLKGGNCKVVTDKNFFHVARLGIVASYRTIPRTRVHFNRLERYNQMYRNSVKFLAHQNLSRYLNITLYSNQSNTIIDIFNFEFLKRNAKLSARYILNATTRSWIWQTRGLK